MMFLCRKQYNSVLDKGWWCHSAGEVIADLAESRVYDYLYVTRGLSAWRLESAPAIMGLNNKTMAFTGFTYFLLITQTETDRQNQLTNRH